jgi:ferredoxin
LKEAIRKALPDLDLVIGWQAGRDPLHTMPLFIRKEEDLDRLVEGPLCAGNLATHLYANRLKKVGIVVKGCDSRSVIQLLQEKLVNRDNLVIFGLPCQGVLDPDKVAKGASPAPVARVEVKDGAVKAAAAESTLDMKSVLADRCLRCKYPNPLVYDHLIGDAVEPVEAAEPYKDLDTFEKKELNERYDFWMEQMSRCTRCYACRNACPLCVCREHCVADSRDPHWLTQETSVRQKWFFQIIHALHLAGRCTECGECERACPMHIPVLLLKRKMNREVKDLFGYEAGVDPLAVPALHTYKIEEDKINEREL